MIQVLFSGKTAKESEDIKDCQDHFQITENCLAIADGASQSFYGGIWAEMLVQYFCQNPKINKKNWQEWLHPIQEQWLPEIKERVERAKRESKPSWITNHNRLKVYRHPATSTFLGLQLTENQIKLSLVGDSCLFIRQDDKLISYPLNSSKDFNDRPEYLASYAENNDFSPHFLDLPLEIEQSNKVYLILATDALAEWILKNREQNLDVLPTFLNISDQNDFEEFVSNARNTQEIRLKNDDVTLVILEILNARVIITDTEQNQSYQETEEALDKKVEETPKIEGTLDKKKEKIINPERSITQLKQENKYLRTITIILGVISLTLSTFLLVEKTSVVQTFPEKNPRVVQTLPKLETGNKSNLVELKKGSIIYNDENQLLKLVAPLANSFQGLIIEERNGLIKFQITLYAHKSVLNACANCADNEIELKHNDNIRTSPSDKQANNIFGLLQIVSRFEKLDSSQAQDWYSFKFVGYIKK